MSRAGMSAIGIAAGFALLLSGVATAGQAAPRPGDPSPAGLHTPFPGTPPGEALQKAMEEARGGDPQKIRALIPFFATEDNERLVRFIVTLKGKAIPPMMEALADPDPRTSEIAAGMLGELRAKEAVPALVARLIRRLAGK